MIHAFLDANILLGLHGLTPQQVLELNKIPLLVQADELTLWLPEVVLDEYDRNRSRVVAEALKAVRESRLHIPLPALSEGMPEREGLLTALKETQRAHSELLAALDRAAHEHTLPADEVIDGLRAVACTPATDPVLALARKRRELRRPPGKAESLGDAISWESLLRDFPDREDLHIVSGDPDFRSALRRDAISEYLLAEWSERKNSEATLYPDLSAFLKQHFAAIQVPSDILKVRLIQRLAASESFESTHTIMERLQRYDVFTPEQAALIAKNAVRNNQVRWIADDEDVREFLTRVIDTHRRSIEAPYLAILERCMNGDQPAYSTIELDGEVL